MLEAGLGIRDITPPPGAPLWGYMDRSGPAEGTLDKLYARSLVLRSGGKCAAIVSLDLGRVPTAAMLQRIERYGAERGIGCLFVSATHTHHGPVMEWEEAPYLPFIEEGICDSLDAALHHLEVVILKHFAVQFEIGHNRRVIRDGQCYMRWRNTDHIPTAPVDSEAVCLLFARPSGEAVALLVHHACHPVTMGPSNLQYSADWPGEMLRLVEEKSGIPGLFVQGAAGDINPFYDKTHLQGGAVTVMRATGAIAAQAIVAGLDSAKTVAGADRIAWTRRLVPCGTRWNLRNHDERKRFAAFYGELYEAWYLAEAGPDLRLTVDVLLLQDAVALVGVPGEPFTLHQQVLKQSGGAPINLLCGYVNGYHAYLPPLREALAGGYGGTVGSYVGLGAIDKLLTEAHLATAELLGELGRPARDSDFFLPEA